MDLINGKLICRLKVVLHDYKLKNRTSLLIVEQILFRVDSFILFDTSGTDLFKPLHMLSMGNICCWTQQNI
jgi:hypothetical protein